MSNPTPPTGSTPDFVAGWNARAVADGTAPPVAVAPVVVTAPVIAPLTPLQRWAAQVHIDAGPYVAAGADPKTVIETAKPGEKISFPPRGKLKLSATTTIPAGVSVFFNGSELDCETSPGTGANIVLSAGCLVNGFHATHGYTLFEQVGRGAKVHDFFSDDYHEIAAGAETAGTWTGIKNRFLQSGMVDVDKTPNLDVQAGWIGETLGQNVYLTCNATFTRAYHSGSPFEYAFRTEVTGPTNANRCQSIVCDTCSFRLMRSNGKGTSVGIRIGAGLEFRNCYIEGNIYVGENPPGVPASATAYVDGCAIDHCTLVGFGEREVVDSNDGVTMSVTNCDIYPDQAHIAIAISPNANETIVAGNTVHVLPAAPFKQLTNSAKVPGSGAVTSAAPYVVPAVLMPF